MKGLLRFAGGALLLFVGVMFLSLTFIFVKRSFFGKHSDFRKAHVAVLDVKGVILSSSSFLLDLKDLLDSSDVKSIVVRVNSPGGLVAPSQEIYQALRRADQKIPVLISMGSLAASGGYYIALGGRRIYANPGTLTASIGVIMEFMNSERLYQWARLERFALKSGKFKDIGSGYRAMRADEKELLNAMIQDIYQQFRGAVKERRGLNDAELDMTTDGRVLTGSQALKAKLVDELKGFDEVLMEARKIANLPEDSPVLFPHSREGLLKQLLLGEASDSESNQTLGAIQSTLATFSLQPGWRVMLIMP